MDLIEKLAPTVYGAFSVFFDEIYDAFINELLLDEVNNYLIKLIKIILEFNF